MPEIRGEQPVCEANGWQNVSVWSGGQTTGDDTIGEEYTSYYQLVGTRWRAEVTFYTVVSPRGCDWETAEEYAVDARTEIFQEADGEQEDLDSDYEGGSYLSYDSIEAAEKEGLRMALLNFDHAFAVKGAFARLSAAKTPEKSPA